MNEREGWIFGRLAVPQEGNGRIEKNLRRWFLPGCILLFFLLTGSFWWDALIRPILFSAPAKAAESDCLMNVQRLAKGMLIYSQDWDNMLPPANRWQATEQSLPLEKPVFACRSGKTGNSYGMNRRVGGVDIVSESIKEPQVTVMFFETDSAVPNAVGDQRDLPAVGRHAERDVYAFVDGHVNRFPRTSKIIW